MFVILRQYRDRNHTSLPVYITSAASEAEAAVEMEKAVNDAFENDYRFDKSAKIVGEGGTPRSMAIAASNAEVVEFFVVEMPDAPSANAVAVPKRQNCKKYAVKISERFERTIVISDAPSEDAAVNLAIELYSNGDIDALNERDFTGETEVELVEEIVTDEDYDRYERYQHFNEEGEMP